MGLKQGEGNIHKSHVCLRCELSLHWELVRLGYLIVDFECKHQLFFCFFFLVQAPLKVTKRVVNAKLFIKKEKEK